MAKKKRLSLIGQQRNPWEPPIQEYGPWPEQAGLSPLDYQGRAPQPDMLDPGAAEPPPVPPARFLRYGPDRPASWPAPYGATLRPQPRGLMDFLGPESPQGWSDAQPMPIQEMPFEGPANPAQALTGLPPEVERPTAKVDGKSDRQAAEIGALQAEEMRKLVDAEKAKRDLEVEQYRTLLRKREVEAGQTEAMRGIAEGLGNIRATTAGEIMSGIAPRETNNFQAEGLRRREEEQRDQITGQKLGAALGMPELEGMTESQIMRLFPTLARMQMSYGDQEMQLAKMQADAAAAAAPKPLTPAQTERKENAKQARFAMEEVLKEFRDKGYRTGWVDEPVANLRQAMGGIGLALPERAAFKAKLKKAAASALKAQTGAQVNQRELDLYMKTIYPTMYEDEDVFDAKASWILEDLKRVEQGLDSAYRASGKDLSGFDATRKVKVYIPSKGSTVEVSPAQAEELKAAEPGVTEVDE